LADSPNWTNSQRLAQYTVDSPCCDETWGGVQFHIDKDIEDGQVIVGAQYKSYSFQPQLSFQIGTNSVDTIPQGITGIHDKGYSGGKVPAGAMADAIVGQWQQVTDTNAYYGFVYDPNVNLDVSDMLGFLLYSINSAGLAAADAPDNSSSSIYDTGTYDMTPGTAFTVSCGSNCIVTGINDARWIAGTMNPGTDAEKGFS
jgi:hypothetical protein